MNNNETATIHLLHPGAYMQCTAWLIEGPEGLILVDTGSGCEEEKLLANLQHLGFTPEQVTHALITHCHCDHSIGAKRWRRFGTRIVASARCAEYLESADPIIWGEHPDLIPKNPVDIRLQDSETLTAAGLTIQGIDTPGHTLGSMTYLIDGEDKRLAFTGDLLLFEGVPGWAGKGQYDAESLLASLQRLLALSLTRVHPGHGAAIDEVDAWLRRGIGLGRAGEWHPNSKWQTMEVPEALQPWPRLYKDSWDNSKPETRSFSSDPRRVPQEALHTKPVEETNDN